MNNFKINASLVVWEGSHKIFRNFFRNIYEGVSSNKISDIDITELYNECRNKVFTKCNVKKIVPNFKQPYLLDRHLLHGIDQWKDQNFSSYAIKHKHSVNNLSNGRIVVYFRPVFSDPYDWIYK